MTPEEEADLRRREAEMWAAGARSSKWAARRTNLEFWVMLLPIIVGAAGFVLVLGIFAYIALG